MEIIRLNKATITEFTSLLPKEPNLIECSYLISIGVRENGQPVGLALASRAGYDAHVAIDYISICPPYFERLLPDLLAYMEKEARQAKAKLISYIYPSNQEESATIEKSLTLLKWEKPRPFMIRCLFDAFAYDVPWSLENDFTYPEHCTDFLWTELKEEERHELRRMQTQQIFSAYVSPFRDEDSLEPLNSLGLRYQGKIAGWMLTHRIDSQTIRYTSMFVLPSIPKRGRAMAKLLSRSIQLHSTQRTAWARLEIPLLQVPPSWSHFVERRLVPFADKVMRLAQGWKNLE